MRVVLTSHGSTGDIVPMIALGRALTAAGHETVFAASTLFQDLIEGAGVPFRRVPPDWKYEDGQSAMKHLARTAQPLKQLQRIYEFGLGFYDEYFDILEELTADADLLVSSYLYPLLASLAERHGAKFAVATFAHNSVPTTVNSPLPELEFSWLPEPLGRAWRGAWWAIGDAVVSNTLNGVVADILKARGMRPAPSFFRRPAPLALVTVSEKLFGPQPGQVDPRFVFTGYWRYQTPVDDTLEAKLDKWCGGQEVPVLCFGSVTWDNAQREFAELLAVWPANKKLIVQSGWAGFQQISGAERPEIKIIGHANHDRLFARASVIIHHGGAGTTASALHAGRPQIVIPIIADQSFWASECRKLGVAMTGDKRYWARRLGQWVSDVENQPTLRRKAEEVAAILKAENGPQRAVAELEKYAQAG